jgi:catalase
VPYNPFDLTKVWPQGGLPADRGRRVELNRNPENYFADVEQAAFNPANIVPGIGFSPDKMLQGRLFSYGDAQRYRLGVNHHQIPVNAARCPVHSYHRDGAMRVDGNHGGTLGYEPNSYGQWQEQPDFAEPPLALDGAAAHWDFREDDDDYFTQPGLLFRLMTKDQQQVLFENTARPWVMRRWRSRSVTSATAGRRTAPTVKAWPRRWESPWRMFPTEVDAGRQGGSRR